VLFDQNFVVRPKLSAEAAAEPPPTVDEEAAQPAQPPPTLPLPQVKGGNFETTVSDRGPTSAASASTVRNLDFDLRPKTSPNDVLRVVPGLLAVQHQGGGKADQLFLRGFDADHGTDVGVFVDGVPVNLPSHAHGQGFADLHWIIPEAIERIDVAKGPYDVRYGDFSTAGAVNLITRKEFPESQIGVTIGGFPTVDRWETTERFVGIAAPKLGGPLEKVHPWIAFEGAHDNGPFDNPENLRRYNLFGKVSLDINPHTQLGLFVSAYGSQWVGSGQIPERAVGTSALKTPFGSLDPSEGGLTERQMMTAFLHHKGDDDEFTATLYVVNYRLALFNDFTFYFENPVNASEIEQDDKRTYAGAKLDYHFHRHWHGLSLRTTFGAEARYDDVHVDRWDVESCSVNGTPDVGCPLGDFRKRIGRHIDTSQFGMFAPGNNDDIGLLNIAAYAEEDVVVNKYLRFLGGLRADYFTFNLADQSETLGANTPNTSGTAQRALVSPKFTAVITPVHDLFELYLNGGMGFHTNQAQIALLDGKTFNDENGVPFKVRAVPRIYGAEIGARLHLWNRIDVAGALWASYLESETVFDADHSTFTPSSPTKRYGVDAEARVRILPWLFADVDVAQATATVDDSLGGALALVPNFYMTAGFTVKHPSGIRAGVRFRYVGPRPAFDEASPEFQTFGMKTLPSGQPNPSYDPDRVMAQEYGIFDAYVAYRWRFLEAQLSAQNLFNQTWREAQFGNHSCTRDETYNTGNMNFVGRTLADGTVIDRCGIGQPDRTGVADVHYTPGVPLNVQATLKAYF
jgi:outer membrane receptor protein involved in Fe transport